MLDSQTIPLLYEGSSAGHTQGAAVLTCTTCNTFPRSTSPIPLPQSPRHVRPPRPPPPVHLQLQHQGSRCSLATGKLCIEHAVARSWMQSCAGRPSEPTWCRSCKFDQYPCVRRLSACASKEKQCLQVAATRQILCACAPLGGSIIH